MFGNEITIIERPSFVSWEDISNVLKSAHAQNVKKGIIMLYPQLSPEQLKEKIESYGAKLFVALDGEKIVGTGAVAILNKDYLWCGKGQYAYNFMDAVMPDYAGRGIYARIAAEQEKYAQENDVDRMLLDTHARNKRMIGLSKKKGYRPVYFRYINNHESIVMVKWLNMCPYSRIECALKFAKIKYNKRKNHILKKDNDVA